MLSIEPSVTFWYVFFCGKSKSYGDFRPKFHWQALIVILRDALNCRCRIPNAARRWECPCRRHVLEHSQPCDWRQQSKKSVQNCPGKRRPFQHGVIFAGTQKNIGAAGLTVVIAQKDLIKTSHPMCPSVLSYATQSKAESVYNTPPVYR